MDNILGWLLAQFTTLPKRYRRQAFRHTTPLPSKNKQPLMSAVREHQAQRWVNGGGDPNKLKRPEDEREEDERDDVPEDEREDWDNGQADPDDGDADSE